MIKKKPSVKLYKSCSDLSIYRFDIMYRTGDLRHLIVDYDGYDEIDVPSEAEARFKAIKEEWIKLIDNSSITYYYQLILEVTYLQMRFEVSKILMYNMWTVEMSEELFDEYIEGLAKWNYFYKKGADKDDEILRLLKQREASENKLNLKLDELKEMSKEGDMNDIKSLEAQAVMLEHITKKNKIDIFTTSVKTWIEIGKLAEEINEQNRKSNGRFRE